MGEISKAKLFMHGRSQAVRLPKQFRMPGTEVEISREGDRVILKPLQRKPVNWHEIYAKLDAIGPGGDIAVERNEGLLPPRPLSFDD